MSVPPGGADDERSARRELLRAGHDLNNLATALLGTLELLRSAPPESREEDLVRLEALVRRVADLGRELLGRVPEGSTEPPPSSADGQEASQV
jgi:signal transduction histidine kinase